jgi:hypothetical protein
MEQMGCARASEEAVELELPPDRSFDAVGRLVAAGLGSRTALGVDRIEALQLALDTFRHRSGAGGPTRLTLRRSEESLRLEIGPLTSRDSAAELERVLSRVVPDLELELSDDSRSITLRVPSGPAVYEGR